MSQSIGRLKMWLHQRQVSLGSLKCIDTNTQVASALKSSASLERPVVGRVLTS